MSVGGGCRLNATIASIGDFGQDMVDLRTPLALWGFGGMWLVPNGTTYHQKHDFRAFQNGQVMFSENKTVVTRMNRSMSQSDIAERVKRERKPVNPISATPGAHISLNCLKFSKLWISSCLRKKILCDQS